MDHMVSVTLLLPLEFQYFYGQMMACDFSSQTMSVYAAYPLRLSPLNLCDAFDYVQLFWSGLM